MAGRISALLELGLGFNPEFIGCQNVYLAGEAAVGIDRRTGKTVVRVNPKFYRPAEVDLLVGNPAKAKRELGWEAKTPLEVLCRLMVEVDSRNERGWSF